LRCEKTGEHEVTHEGARRGFVGQVDRAGGRDGVSQYDAGEPFAGPVGAFGGEEPLERGRDGGTGPDEEPVAGVERDVREDDLGLEREEELQSLVVAQLARGAHDHRHHRVLARGLGIGGSANTGGDARCLAQNGDPHQLPLAAEIAVQGGAGASGLASDVVEGRLGEPVAGDAGERGPDRAVLDAPGGARGEARGLGGGGGEGHLLFSLP
jgi:hypothetical protein